MGIHHQPPLTRQLPGTPGEVGFDYSAAVQRLKTIYRDYQITQFLGYMHERSVYNIAKGVHEPPHRIGEKLYILYVETFNEKPPSLKNPST